MSAGRGESDLGHSASRAARLVSVIVGIIDVETPTELLQPQQISYVIQKLNFEFDWIIVDCPPVLVLSDAVSLTPHVDGSLLVARAGVPPSKLLRTQSHVWAVST